MHSWINFNHFSLNDLLLPELMGGLSARFKEEEVKPGVVMLVGPDVGEPT